VISSTLRRSLYTLKVYARPAMSITSADAEKVTCAGTVPLWPSAVRPRLYDHITRQAWTPYPFGKVKALAQVAGGCCWHVSARVLRHGSTLKPGALAANDRCCWLLLADGTQGQALLHALEPACAKLLIHQRLQQIGTTPAFSITASERQVPQFSPSRVVYTNIETACLWLSIQSLSN
jgi:hypothetical protein